eukprot:10131879-Alexandrium_andersonii.AAC.1
MSASLVGSEMCIRDSTYAHPHASCNRAPGKITHRLWGRRHVPDIPGGPAPPASPRKGRSNWQQAPRKGAGRQPTGDPAHSSENLKLPKNLN